jgi:Fic family protein
MSNLPRPRGRPPRRAVHERLALMVEELRTRLGGLPSPAEADAIWTDIWYHEAHSSTALEGNTLIRKEVEVLLSEGKAVGSKELKDYLEVTGYASAARWVYSQAAGGVVPAGFARWPEGGSPPLETGGVVPAGFARRPEGGSPPLRTGGVVPAGGWTSGKLLTLTEVRHVHRLAMTPVWEVAPHPEAVDTEGPGNWRRHDLHPFGGGMRPPEHTQIPSLIQDWVDLQSEVPLDPAPIGEVVARHHAAFERIHPFLDGNGRVGRLLMNLVLVRLGYPPAIIQKRERERYLDALERADGGDPGPLGELTARAILDNLTRFVVPAIAGPAQLVPLEALASQDLSAIALRNAAHRSRLKAIRANDGSWRSSRQWVAEYRESRYATLRLPRKHRMSEEAESD